MNFLPFCIIFLLGVSLSDPLLNAHVTSALKLAAVYEYYIVKTINLNESPLTVLECMCNVFKSRIVTI